MGFVEPADDATRRFVLRAELMAEGASAVAVLHDRKGEGLTARCLDSLRPTIRDGHLLHGATVSIAVGDVDQPTAPAGAISTDRCVHDLDWVVGEDGPGGI